jgi:hypothetical protein
MEKDKIMAGQNHAAPPLMVLPARILFLLRMILCGHDSVGLLGLPTKPSQLAHKLAYCSADVRKEGSFSLRSSAFLGVFALTSVWLASLPLGVFALVALFS